MAEIFDEIYDQVENSDAEVQQTLHLYLLHNQQTVIRMRFLVIYLGATVTVVCNPLIRAVEKENVKPLPLPVLSVPRILLITINRSIVPRLRCKISDLSTL